MQLGQGEAGWKADTRLVKRLHLAVATELKARHAHVEQQLNEAKRAGDRMRKASLQQAAAAHSGRGAELRKRGAVDRSSGDSASVGSVAPRQAPVRINR